MMSAHLPPPDPAAHDAEHGGAQETILDVRAVSKTFPRADAPALRDVSFSVAQGEILCLLGPSGCGKTTLLRVIAGLEQADSGQVLLDGAALDRAPVHQRNLGLMFQEYALFPHKDVYGNVAFGLRMARLSRVEVERRVDEALALVGLGGFARRAVHELSGGEQQRVALARSLAPRPRLLMLDEPLGSLDRALRERLMNELHQILKSASFTALYVTHDQSEAFALGDRVAIMQQGCIEQIGPPETVYRQPKSAFVARFLGMNNLLPGYVVNAETGRVVTPLGELQARPAFHSAARRGLEIPPTNHARRNTQYASSQEITVLLRPEAARWVTDTQEITNLLHTRVVERSFRGAFYRLVVRHDSGIELSFEMEEEGGIPSVGDEVALSLRPQAINLLPPSDARGPVVKSRPD